MDRLELADWRERVARLYVSDVDVIGFRRARDELFRTHAQSPVPDRAAFTGLPYFDPDPAYVCESPVRPTPGGTLDYDTGGADGVIRYEAVGVAETPYGPLTLWWISAYGGGLFLPVRDGTSGRESYGGGRYLTDTVKGTFGRGLTLLDDDRVRLDFNYLYNPSCAYDDQWLCPLAPPENRITEPIRAGELAYTA
jgi:uncharacterized protein (DUF1684 family)